MGDDELGQDFEDASGGGGGKKGLPTFVIVIIIAVVMGAGGFFAGKMFFGGEEKETPPVVQNNNTDGRQPPANNQQPQAAPSDGQPQDTPADDGSEMVSKSESGLLVLDPFTVNLNDPFGRRYIEVVVNLEISKKTYVTKINENELMKPRVRDEIFMIISAKSYNELNSTSGKVTLKEEIMMRVNELMKEEFGKEPVTRVYFTKIIIQ